MISDFFLSFGKPSFGASFAQQPLPQNATYSDMKRRWTGLSPTHLENLAQAVAASNNEADITARKSTHTNLLHAAGESTTTERAVTKHGRTLNDAIDIGGDGECKESGKIIPFSILHSPVLLSSNHCQEEKEAATDETMFDAQRSTSPPLSMDVKSSYWEAGKKTAETMREYLSVREQVRSTESEMKTLKNSLAKQEETVNDLSAKFLQVGKDSSIDGTAKLDMFDQIQDGKQNCERVINQLQRKINELTMNHKKNTREYERLEGEVQFWEAKRKSVVKDFRDPFGSWRGPLHNGHRRGGNGILHSVLSRQQGMFKSRLNSFPSRSLITNGPTMTHFATNKKTLFCSRLSHVATINTHLSYPVYCLRFDRTGRYFVTGADDYLIKVFYLGAGQSCLRKNEVNGSRLLRCNYGANMRGAVLVCSLRGHAGVINDIDVSSDNCFLATASVDGDVRIWGLKDGSPVAILRGHKGGANMVRFTLVA